MTDASHRLYALVIAAVVFLTSWATVAAKPWATSKPDPRLAALAQREQRLRAEGRLVQRIVGQRLVAYEAALRARKARIAASQAAALQVAQTAPAVRVVNLPPLTITRTS